MFRQMKYFQAVVRSGSFTLAAEECFISQSAISQQIQSLEQALGVQLLVRERRKITLTPAGEYFYQRSLLLTEDVEKLCRETVRIANESNARLRIGYLKGYGGQELQQAIDEFSSKYPNVDLSFVGGNHEDLYGALRTGEIDLVLNDQRRAFSEEYVNCILTTVDFSIEISDRSPLARRKCVTAEDLKALPCILVAAPDQYDSERVYYQEIIGLKGDLVFASSLEEARLMVIGGRGYLPIEGDARAMQSVASLCRLPLYRAEHPIQRIYCAFWRADNPNLYNPIFAEILKSKFDCNP